MANPRAFYRGSRVSPGDVEGGLANCWLLGEAQADYAPWGYPFNWRQLEDQNDLARFGTEWASPQFLMADESVRAVDGEIEPDIVAAMSRGLRWPGAELTTKPSGRFVYGPAPHFESVGIQGGDVAFMIHMDSNGSPLAGWVEYKSKMPTDGPTGSDLAKLHSTYPQLSEIHGLPLSEQTIGPVARFRQLEVLTGRLDLQPSSLQELSRLKALRAVRLTSVPLSSQPAIQSALPQAKLILQSD